MITRTTQLSGPASATWNGHKFFAQDGITVHPALELIPVSSEANGPLDATVRSQPTVITFTPCAPFADLAPLFPSLSPRFNAAPGAPLFSWSNTPLVLIDSNGTRVTFTRVAITKMPDLHLTARGVIPGPVTFLALTAPIIDSTTPAVFPTPRTTRLSADFRVTWGAWNPLRSRTGIRFTTALRTTSILSDANALLGLTLTRLDVELRFAPAAPQPGSPAESDLLAALSLSGSADRALSLTAAPLLVTSDAFSLQIPSASLQAANLVYQPGEPRLGELSFTATRAIINTQPAPLFTLTP